MTPLFTSLLAFLPIVLLLVVSIVLSVRVGIAAGLAATWNSFDSAINGKVDDCPMPEKGGQSPLFR